MSQLLTEEAEIGVNDIFRKSRAFISYLMSHWWKLMIIGLISASLGFIMAYYSKVTYTANVSFVLEESRASGSGLSAIAGQLGLDLGTTTTPSTLLAGDNIIGLLKSKRFTREALLSPFNGKYSVADYYAEVYGLRKAWKGNASIGTDIYFPPNAEDYNRIQDSLLQTIETAIIKTQLSVNRSDKKMTFFEVKAIFKDELLAAAFTKKLVSSAVAFYIDTKTQRLRINVERLQRRADSLAGLLNNRTYNAAAAQSKLVDLNPAYQTAGVSAEVTSRDKVMIGTIYAEIVKNLEIQKVSLSQETPVIQIVDDVELPLVKNKKSKSLYTLIGGILGGLFGIGFFTIRKSISK